jgi:hypothetical protein
MSRTKSQAQIFQETLLFIISDLSGRTACEELLRSIFLIKNFFGVSFQQFKMSGENSRPKSGIIAMAGVKHINCTPSEFADKNTLEIIWWSRWWVGNL